jgi:4,5:9,10-diseco-3-hydroxy-5,9,17-trioxoandrosta-1(10),2-diene-4-oate hydrolase
MAPNASIEGALERPPLLAQDISQGTRAILGAETGCTAVIDGVRLAYDDEGSGAAIVCLHAIGHGASDFARLRRRFRASHRVIALDFPGQGRSGADREPPSAQRYASLLVGLLDHIGVERPVLVGNSIGGAAALIHAAAHPDRVRALVLENPGGLAPNDDAAARFALAGMVRFFAAGARGARWFPPAFAAYQRFAVLRRRSAAEQRRRIVATAYESAPLLERAWRGFAAREADLRPLATRVRCPVLFAWAKRDRFIALRRSLPTIRLFPDARLETFRAGHAAHLETPERFEASLERFLAGLP